MPKKEPKQRPPSILGQILKIYRDTHDVTQEQLATMLDVEPRTLRRWENGETILTDVYELKRIADRLGIAHEHLGIAVSIYTPLPVEQIYKTLDRVWQLIDEARISDARAIVENLVRETNYQITTGDSAFLNALVAIYRAAGHATALSTRTDQVEQALYYYQHMEYFARLLKDDTQINIALAYQGDMLRRKGELSSAITYLEAASETTLQADTSSRGNTAQLLGRAYLQAGKVKNFDSAMKEAEELAHRAKQQVDSTARRYNLATVYEEYAKSYGRLGKIQQALDYIDLAEKVSPPTKNMEILLKVARSEILIRSGDIHNGEPLAVEAALYSRKHGHHRRLERIYALKRYLHQQVLTYGKAETALSEVLEGPIEY
jgi:transcriptional regulator with XRE-family HTH domain